MHGVIGDFERHLGHVPEPADTPRIVALLGGTIGNFLPGTRRRLLREIGRLLGPRDRLLLGTDLVKNPAVIEAAYDDSAGVTAEFNRNVLHVINRELDADFCPEAFDHIAFFDRRHEWVEMRLRVAAAVHGARRRPRAPGRIRRRRGAPHRDQRQVHARARPGRLRGRRSARSRPGTPTRTSCSRCRWPRGHEDAGAGHPPVGFPAMQIEGSGALVAGGASGLGEATVRRLHAGGAHVVIADLNEDGGRGLEDELGDRATFVRTDVTDEDAVLAAVGAAASQPVPLRIAVSCAGIGWAAACRRKARRAPARAVRDRHPRQPDRHVQRAAARRRDDARERADRDRRTGRVRQHRVDRGVRRADRTDRLLGLEGRDRRHDPAGGARPLGGRHPRLHDRARARSTPRCWLRSRRSPATRSARPCRSRRVSAARTSSPRSSRTSSRTRCSTAR